MEGRIISQKSDLYQVEMEEKIYQCKARGKFKNEEISPVVGDKVEFQILDKEKKEGIIEKIFPRINYIKRPKIANLTQIIFVLSCKDPKPDLLLLDKQLAYAEYLKIKPIIIINKTDLDKKNMAEKIKEIYEKVGYFVILTKAKQKEGVEELKKKLVENISAFSGNSGVGKSTLINALFKEEKTQEGDISQKNKKGKNTTTSVFLHKLEKDTYIAYTPGFSSFDISEITSKELENYFIEFQKYISNCEYIGCNHNKEEKCGIKEAVRLGNIPQERYENFIRIFEELKDREEHKW